MSIYDIEETIALDLGTSNSCCYYFKDLTVHPLSFISANTLPSVISFTFKRTIFGEAAVHNKGKPDTAYELKRILGRKYDDPVVQECIKSWSFTIEANEKGLPVAVLKSKNETFKLKPVDFYTYLINYFKEQVEKKIERKVKSIILTVPAYFGEHQRKATTFAAKTADLDVVYLMNEPTAAAIAYACENDLRNKTILIYDLGGGTFDVSILRVTNSFDVIATSGDAHLGGIDFTNRLYEWLLDSIKEEVGEIELTEKMKGKLQVLAEEAKLGLSANEFCDIDLEDLDIELSTIGVTREVFDRITRDLIERSKSAVLDCLSQAGMIPKDIDEVIMIGGSSRIPAVRDAMTSFFGGREVKATINPDEAVARGAMCFVCQKAGHNMVCGMNDITDGTNIPVGGEGKVFAPESIEIHDISPMQYVIEIPNDEVDIVVPKGARLPFIQRKYYRTYEDYQTFISIHIAQGNSMKYSENDEYGELTIDNIPQKPKGEVRVELVATVDAFCQVSFKAFCNGIPAHLSVTNNQWLTDIDGGRIKADIEKTKLIQIRNKCSKMIDALHKLLDTIDDDDVLSEATEFYEQMSDWFDQAENAIEEDYENAVSNIQSYLNVHGAYSCLL